MNLELSFTCQRKNFQLNLDCTIKASITGLFGKSGSGKSMSLETIAGIQKPNSGKIVFNNRILFDSESNINIPPQKRRIAIIFQDLRLFNHLGVKANLEYGMRFVPGNLRKIEFNDVIKLLELDKFLDRSPVSLSGGEKQRVAIGRALLCSPELLLLDEPFSSIDNDMRQAILPYLKTIQSTFHIPMLIVSHHLPDLHMLTKDILLIENGELKGRGKADEVLKICKCGSKKEK